MKLTKTLYVEYALCPKKAWFELYAPRPKNKAETTRQLDGKKAGQLARDFFGKNKCINADSNNPQTKPGIYAEYPLRYQNLECYCDLLRINNDGSIDIFEVKAVNDIYRAKKLKPQLLEDVSFQYYVASKLGLNVKSINLMHFNRDYIFDGQNLLVDQLFVYDDVTNISKNRIDDVKNKIQGYFSLDKNKAPSCPFSMACNLHGEDCIYLDKCKEEKGLPTNNSTYDLYSVKIEKRNELIDSNLKTFEDLYNSREFNTLSQFNQIMIKNMVENLPTYVDVPLLKKFISSIKYPIFFLDFETCQETFPKYKNSRPYSQIPFQYSLHIMRKFDGDLNSACKEHKEYLGNGVDDPREDLAKQLINDLEDRGSIVAYHSDFEEKVIKQLAKDYPHLSQELLKLVDRIIDLETVFSQKKKIQTGYYAKRTENSKKGDPKYEEISSPCIYKNEMGSSCSIKHVLPAFYPNDNDLNYNNLKDVHRGDEAIEAYKKLATLTSKPEIDELRNNMLKYCCLDTKAMVALFIKFYDLAYSDQMSLFEL